MKPSATKVQSSALTGVFERSASPLLPLLGLRPRRRGGEGDVNAWRVHAGFVLVVAEDDLGNAVAYGCI